MIEKVPVTALVGLYLSIEGEPVGEAFWAELITNPAFGVTADVWKSVPSACDMSNRVDATPRLTQTVAELELAGLPKVESVVHQYTGIELRLRKDAPDDYVARVRAFANTHPELKDNLVMAIDETLASDSKTSGGRWYAQLPKAIRVMIRSDLDIMTSAIATNTWVDSYAHWVSFNGITAADEDPIVPPTDETIAPEDEENEPEPDLESQDGDTLPAYTWAAGQLPPPPPDAESSLALAGIGIEKIATDRDITPQETEEFWAQMEASGKVLTMSK